MSHTVLVTGGAGFIGSHLSDLLLERGHRVVVLDNESTGDRDNIADGATFLPGDVRDATAVSEALAHEVDVVCHIAGQASIRLSYDNPSEDLGVNVGGTVNVIRGCLAAGVPRLLFASSMTVYGQPALVPTIETVPAVPVSYYGVTKYAAERYVHVTGDRTDLATPLHVTSFRMFNVFGPRQRLDNPYQGVLAIFLGNLLRGEPVAVHGNGEQSRDFIHVSDVVRAWADAIDAETTFGRVYNIGSGTPTSVNALLDTLLAEIGEQRAHYPISQEPAQQGDIRVSAADISRISAELGWRPTTSMAEGLANTVEWARSVETLRS